MESDGIKSVSASEEALQVKVRLLHAAAAAPAASAASPVAVFTAATDDLIQEIHFLYKRFSEPSAR